MLFHVLLDIMDRRLVFKHRHAHQIAPLGMDAYFIVTSLFKCPQFTMIYVLCFSEATVLLVLFHQIDVRPGLTAHRRVCPLRHAQELVLPGMNDIISVGHQSIRSWIGGVGGSIAMDRTILDPRRGSNDPKKVWPGSICMDRSIQDRIGESEKKQKRKRKNTN